MKIIETAIPDVKIIEPTVFGDDRGFFYESFNQNKFENLIGRKIDFVQDNHSHSTHGVLRGLHYQMPPFAQAKLVRCVTGSVLDIAVDVRESSPHFGKAIQVVLSAENKKMLWIPEGFAHGFITLSDSANFLYKTNNYYTPKAERCILWNDPDLAIPWPSIEPIISEKDKNGIPFTDAEKFS